MSITIFVKQICGKTISVTLDSNNTIANLYSIIYSKRDEQQKLATFENYLRCISYMSGRNKIIYKSDESIQLYNLSTIIEVLKPWTAGFGINFNFDTLLGECPITLQPIITPLFLNSGCGHCFEQQALIKWLRENNLSCPVCKEIIIS